MRVCAEEETWLKSVLWPLSRCSLWRLRALRARLDNLSSIKRASAQRGLGSRAREALEVLAPTGANVEALPPLSPLQITSTGAGTVEGVAADGSRIRVSCRNAVNFGPDSFVEFEGHVESPDNLTEHEHVVFGDKFGALAPLALAQQRERAAACHARRAAG